jgi:hypothetical protein
LVDLLHQQKIYWKQRGTVKWVKFGDASTKFFHLNATIKHRKKMITTVKNKNEQELYNHDAKADLLWTSYKERLGSSNSVSMPPNLEELFPLAENLDPLEVPFTHEEIDVVVKSLATNKAPGPDGFNNDFLKKMLANHWSRLLYPL